MIHVPSVDSLDSAGRRFSSPHVCDVIVNEMSEAAQSQAQLAQGAMAGMSAAIARIKDSAAETAKIIKTN